MLWAQTSSSSPAFFLSSCFSFVTSVRSPHFCGFLFAAQAGAFCLGHNVHALRIKIKIKKTSCAEYFFRQNEATFWRDQHMLHLSFMDGYFIKCHCDGISEDVIWPSCNLWFFSKREGATRGHTAQTLHGRCMAHWPFHLR